MQLFHQQPATAGKIPISQVIDDLCEIIEHLKVIGGTDRCPTLKLRGSYTYGTEKEPVTGNVTLNPKTLWVFTKACYPILLSGIAQGGFQSPQLKTTLAGIAQLQRASKQALSQEQWPEFNIEGLEQLKLLLKSLTPTQQTQQTQTPVPKK